jgi:hypothetical protein
VWFFILCFALFLFVTCLGGISTLLLLWDERVWLLLQLLLL